MVQIVLCPCTTAGHCGKHCESSNSAKVLARLGLLLNPSGKDVLVGSYPWGFGFGCGIASGRPLLLRIPPEGSRGETGALRGVSNRYSTVESASV